MEDLYNYYVNTLGWWNNYQAGNFSIEHFLGMMLLYELGPAVSGENWVIRAATLQIWGDSTSVGGHGPYCTDTCRNGVFNFLAAYAQSAQKRYDLLIRHIDPTDGSPNPNYNPGNDYVTWPSASGFSEDALIAYFSRKASSIGFQILNPDHVDTIYSNDKPYHWGNYSRAGTLGSFYRFQNFYVFSVAQLNSANSSGGTLIQVP